MKTKRPPSKIMTLIMSHAEKIGLSLTLLVAILIILAGFGARQGIEPTKSPKALEQQVNDTTTFINNFKWETDFKKQRVVEEDLLQRARETLKQVSADEYASAQYIKPPYHARRKMRTDPQIFAPLHVQARAGWGTLSKRAGNRRGMGQMESANQEPGRPLPSGTGRPDAMGRGGSNNVEGTLFVAVTGLVPYRQQVKEYFDRFRSADGYNPNRDFPQYRNFSLERAVVHTGKEPEWREIATADTMRNDAMRWEQSYQGRDVVRPDSTLRQLTSPIPPLTGSQLDSIARHDKIPGLRGGGMDGGAGNDWMMEGGGDGPGRRRMGGPPGEFRGGGPGQFEERRGTPVMSERDGGRRFREGGPREGGGGPQFDSVMVDPDTNPEDLPEFIMFRYFDFNVKPGETYQYRLRLTLEDPNSPRESSLSPDASSLSDEVASRLDQKQRRRNHDRVTDFSPASNPAMVLPGQLMVMGRVTAARETSVDGGKVTYTSPRNPAKAKMVMVAYDQQRIAELPVEVDMMAGSTGYARGKVEPIYRWKSWIGVPEDNTIVRVNAVIVDLQGGDMITPKNKGDLTAPGSALIWDAAKQQLIVASEIRDEPIYPEYKVPAEDMRGMGGDLRGDGERGPEERRRLEREGGGDAGRNREGGRRPR